MKYTIKDVFARLEELLPSTDYRLIPEESAQDGKWWSLRIATPFSYPDGETMYVYVEIADGKKQLIRLHDDEVLQDWLTHHDLFRRMLAMKRAIGKTIFKPIGASFVRSKESNAVTMTTHVDDVFSRIPDFAAALEAAIVLIKQNRTPVRKQNRLAAFLDSLRSPALALA